MSSKFTIIFAVAILAILIAAIFANSMTKELGRDEHVYCTGGVLMAQGRTIYRDFSYIAQMPYHPLLYAVLFKILDTTYYLLTGRIASTISDILVVLCIVGIYRKVFDPFANTGLLLGIAAAVLYVFNPVVDYANGFAWNNDVVILCIVAALRVFISIDFEHKSRYQRIAIIGLLLTLATCMRITVVPVGFLFFIILLLCPAKSIKQRMKNVLPFLGAAVVVLAWPIWTIIHEPRAFFLNLLVIPKLNSQWLDSIGMTYNKTWLMLNFAITPACFLLILLTICLWVMVFRQRAKLAITNKINMLASLLSAATFFIIALLMPTIWKQHLAMPVPFLIISFAYPLVYLRKLADSKHFKIAAGIVTVCVLITFISGLVTLVRIPKLLSPQSWVPIQLHKTSVDIAEKSADPKLILTLAPLYALEGRSDIYPELSSGSFVYRIAKFMDTADLAITRTVSPETLRELIKDSPPSTVILGAEMEFVEESLYRMAVRDDWIKHTYDNGPIVYFRPW